MMEQLTNSLFADLRRTNLRMTIIKNDFKNKKNAIALIVILAQKSPEHISVCIYCWLAFFYAPIKRQQMSICWQKKMTLTWIWVVEWACNDGFAE